MSQGLYILSLIVRCLILFAFFHDCGWRGGLMAWAYGLICVISEIPEVIV